MVPDRVERILAAFRKGSYMVSAARAGGVAYRTWRTWIAQQTREWAWSKLVGFHDDEVAAWTGIAVSNRQKISGIAYPPADAATLP
jgi:hypothetical protein